MICVLSWLANHLLVPIIAGIAVGVALRVAAIAGEVGRHDLRAEEIDTDLTRWVRDRGRVLDGAIFHAINMARQGVIEDVAQMPVPKELEGTRPGDLADSGAFLARTARLMRQALHEYRDEASSKVREYRTMARSEGWLHGLVRWWRRDKPPATLVLSEHNRAVLGTWRERTIPVYGDPTAKVDDDPTRVEDAADIQPLEQAGLTWEIARHRRRADDTS